MPHYTRCFLDKLNEEAEKASNACDSLLNEHTLQSMIMATNAAAAAAVNAVCISKMFETEVLDAAGRIQREVCAISALAKSVGINTVKDDYSVEDSKAAAAASVNKAIAAAKKAEAITLDYIQKEGMRYRVKRATIVVDVSTATGLKWRTSAAYAICILAIALARMLY